MHGLLYEIAHISFVSAVTLLDPIFPMTRFAPYTAPVSHDPGTEVRVHAGSRPSHRGLRGPRLRWPSPFLRVPTPRECLG